MEYTLLLIFKPVNFFSVSFLNLMTASNIYNYLLILIIYYFYHKMKEKLTVYIVKM